MFKKIKNPQRTNQPDRNDAAVGCDQRLAEEQALRVVVVAVSLRDFRLAKLAIRVLEAMGPRVVPTLWNGFARERSERHRCRILQAIARIEQLSGPVGQLDLQGFLCETLASNSLELNRLSADALYYLRDQYTVDRIALAAYRIRQRPRGCELLLEVLRRIGIRPGPFQLSLLCRLPHDTKQRVRLAAKQTLEQLNRLRTSEQPAGTT